MKLRAQQSGAALMVMLAVLVLGAAWWAVTALSNTANRSALETQHNARVLGQAKTALLGYLAHRALITAENHPGRLPCPEAPAWQNNHDGTNYIADDDGITAGSCTLPAVGRLPWRTLGIDKLVDATGEPLWYVVSPGWAFAFPGATPVINSNTAGQLGLDGQTVVALIIAPGRPIGVAASAGCTARTQIRRRQPNVPWDLRDFLECENANSPADLAFVTNGPRDSFNDHVLAITASEVWLHVEPAVAERMRNTVVPQLQSIYASATWGASAADPLYPFPARFRNDAGTTFNPESYEGRRYGNDANTAGLVTQGLLPVTASVCNALTAGRCDAGFVLWNTATISAVQTGGSATSFSANCAASTTTEIRCDVTYSRLLCLLICGITADVRVRVNGTNVGMTLKTLNPAAATGLTTLTAPLQPDGSALATYTGTLEGGSAGLCGSLIGLLCTGNATIRIPITVFQDHPLVNPVATDTWYWFMLNRWYEVTYYAVAPSHVPDAPPLQNHNCTAVGNCLTVAGGSPATNVRAVLVLGGRSLSGNARPNASLADLLDTVENQNVDTAFQQNLLNRAFNDRFVTLSNY